MAQVVIRQSGGANIVSIPKALLESLNLKTGCSLDLAVEDNKIVLTPVPDDELSLASLIASSPSEKMKITAEDAEWVHSPGQGQEIL